MKNFSMVLTVLSLAAVVACPAWPQPHPSPSMPSGRRIHSSPRTPTTHSNQHSVNTRLRAMKRQVTVGLRSGKLTKEQAQKALDNLRTVRRRELEYFRQNGKKEITSEQKDKLNTLLDQTNGTN